METIKNYQCNLCGATLHRVRFELHNKKLIVCKGCGIISYYPLPDEKELYRIYEDHSYFESNYFQIDEEKVQTAHYKHFQQIADVALQCCGKTRKLLEIGPGHGAFLKLCLEKGITCEGYEISHEIATQLRQQLQITVHEGLIENELM